MIRCFLIPARMLFFLGFLPVAATLARADDIDNDGVEDSIDACSDTPNGVAVDESGRPLGDQDGDCDVDLADFLVIQETFTGPLAGGCWTDAHCEDQDACTVDRCDVETGGCDHTEVPNCRDCVLPPDCTAMDCGDFVDGEINPFIETDRYCFCVGQNEHLRIFVTELGATSFAPAWRVLDAGGNSVGPCGGTLATTAGRDCGPLPAAGNPYVIEVEDQGRNETGLYSVHLHRYHPSAECGAMDLAACETTATGEIENVNDADLFNLEAQPGEVVRISVIKDAGSNASFATNWRLIDGNGSPVAGCDAFVTTVSRECGPLVAELNPYRVEVEDQGRNFTGTFLVHVQRMTSFSACGVFDASCDERTIGVIESFFDSDLFNFTAGQGEMIRISMLKGAGSGASFAPNWRTVNGKGQPIGSCAAFTTTASRDCGLFPSIGGPYRLEIEDQSRNDIGAYEFHLQRLTQFFECDVLDVACGQGVDAAIGNLIDTDLFRFTAPEDETVRISVLEQPGGGVNFAPNWRVLNAAGFPASNCSGFAIATSRDCGPLPASGNPYRVEVEDQGRNDFGPYRMLVEFLNSGCGD